MHHQNIAERSLDQLAEMQAWLAENEISYRTALSFGQWETQLMRFEFRHPEDCILFKLRFEKGE